MRARKRIEQSRDGFAGESECGDTEVELLTRQKRSRNLKENQSRAD